LQRLLWGFGARDGSEPTTGGEVMLTGTTALETAVCEWINEQAEDYDDGAQGAMKDLAQGGCVSGIVGELCYYADTLKFYRRHSKDINDLLVAMVDDTGMSVPELFGDKWDDADPLAMDRFNQNLLAWWGFEEAARCVASRAGLDL